MMTGSFDYSQKVETIRGEKDINLKYNVAKFKANYGYISAMKKFVDQYIKLSKKEDPDTIVMEETNDDKSKIWIVGKPDDIKRMVDDALKSSQS